MTEFNHTNATMIDNNRKNRLHHLYIKALDMSKLAKKQWNRTDLRERREAENRQKNVFLLTSWLYYDDIEMKDALWKEVDSFYEGGLSHSQELY